MKSMTFHPSQQWHPIITPTKKHPTISQNTTPLQLPKNLTNTSSRTKPFLSFATTPSKTPTHHQNPNPPPLVVVGSANADIYVEIDRLPKEGETISAKTGQTLAGGKGANQAACAGKLSYPTYFVGQVGEDAHGRLISDALECGGVHLDHLNIVSAAPTGHAVVMLQSDGQNSIIIVGGANMCCWPDKLSDEDLEVVRKAGIVLLQREIPDLVNIQVAKAAQHAGIPVILDAGGMEGPIPVELLCFVDILSPNETELERLTGIPTENFEQISRAVIKCHEMHGENLPLNRGDLAFGILFDIIAKDGIDWSLFDIIAKDGINWRVPYPDMNWPLLLVFIVHFFFLSFPSYTPAIHKSSQLPSNFYLLNFVSYGKFTALMLSSIPRIEIRGSSYLELTDEGVKQVLVKLGAKGSALFSEGEEPIRQPIFSATKVLDTTGAGDTFTAAFAVALVEGKSKKDSLRFAAAAASLCVQVKGAIPSMPNRKAVLDLLKSI